MVRLHLSPPSISSQWPGPGGLSLGRVAPMPGQTAG